MTARPALVILCADVYVSTSVSGRWRRQTRIPGWVGLRGESCSRRLGTPRCRSRTTPSPPTTPVYQVEVRVAERTRVAGPQSTVSRRPHPAGCYAAIGAHRATNPHTFSAVLVTSQIFGGLLLSHTTTINYVKDPIYRDSHSNPSWRMGWTQPREVPSQ